MKWVPFRAIEAQMAYPFAKASAPRSSNDYAMEPVSSGGWR
jgi:hypothetical protein